MNVVLLMGRLTKDPAISYTQDKKSVARFTLAVDRRYKKDETDFISCVAFGKTAEFAEKYLKKGTKVVTEGHWQTGSYTNKDGVKVYTNDCFVDAVEFAESKGAEAPKPAPTGADSFMSIPEDVDEEIPFGNTK